MPEVETIKRDLQRVVVGRTVKSVEVKVGKLFKGDKKILTGKKFEKVERLAKMLVLHFSGGIDLTVHLKMTGQLIFLPRQKNQPLKSEIYNLESATQSVVGGHPDSAYNQPLPHKHTHIIITFTDGSTLYYNDLRKFGWMAICRRQIELKTKNLKFCHLDLGIDALDDNLTPDYLRKICQNKKISIKQLLLDQKKIAGIGNIYSDEILFCARVLPTKKSEKLSKNEIAKITKCIPKILNRSIKAGGTSRSDYRKLDGSKGGYLDLAWVYGREGLPCRVCQTPIKRIKIGQRSSHYCPSCQK